MGSGAIAGPGDLYQLIGLNETEIDLIKSATKKRHYYYTSAEGRRLFDLRLGPVALAFTAVSSRDDLARVRALMQLMEKIGRGLGLNIAASIQKRFLGAYRRYIDMKKLLKFAGLAAMAIARPPSRQAGGGGSNEAALSHLFAHAALEKRPLLGRTRLAIGFAIILAVVAAAVLSTGWASAADRHSLDTIVQRYQQAPMEHVDAGLACKARPRSSSGSWEHTGGIDMKKLLKFARLAIIAIAWASAAQPSFAQCAGPCASELTQLLNMARLVDQLATQGNILTTGTNQLHLATVNTTPFTSLSMSTNGGGLQSYNSTLSSGTAISFASPEPHQLVQPAKQQLHHLPVVAANQRDGCCQTIAVVGEYQLKRALDTASRPTSIDRDDRYRAKHT